MFAVLDFRFMRGLYDGNGKLPYHVDCIDCWYHLARHHKMPSSLHYDIITAKNSLGGRDTLL